MDKIVKFFECLMPNSVCNLKCEYCYVIQNNDRKMQPAVIKHTAEEFGKAFSRTRLGGSCFVSICGQGETLVQDELVDIIHEILAQGHYVNVTNNGTITRNISKLMSFPEDYRKRMHFSFSLHYDELKNRNLLKTFFDNVHLVKESGCSYIVQLNLCDKYISQLAEIKERCLEEIGTLPQVAVTRNQSINPYKFFTSLSDQEYIDIGKSFDSKMFELGIDNINRKQKQFCYAGEWSYILNMGTGMFKRCYSEAEEYDFFEDLNNPLPNKPIGKHCKSPYCINSIHFLSLGMVPEYKCETYCGVRNRKCSDGTEFFNDVMKEVLDTKLYQTNKEHTAFQKAIIDCFNSIKGSRNKLKWIMKRFI